MTNVCGSGVGFLLASLTLLGLSKPLSAEHYDVYRGRQPPWPKGIPRERWTLRTVPTPDFSSLNPCLVRVYAFWNKALVHRKVELLSVVMEFGPTPEKKSRKRLVLRHANTEAKKRLELFWKYSEKQDPQRWPAQGPALLKHIRENPPQTLCLPEQGNFLFAQRYRTFVREGLTVIGKQAQKAPRGRVAFLYEPGGSAEDFLIVWQPEGLANRDPLVIGPKLRRVHHPVIAEIPPGTSEEGLAPIPKGTIAKIVSEEPKMDLHSLGSEGLSFRRSVGSDAPPYRVHFLRDSDGKRKSLAFEAPRVILSVPRNPPTWVIRAGKVPSFQQKFPRYVALSVCSPALWEGLPADPELWVLPP